MLPVSQQIDQSLPGRGVLEDDRPHDQCGVFGVWAPGEDVSRLTYFSLYALQHRGQQSAGIAASDGSKILVYKDQGLVNQVFSEQSLQGLRGHIAVGHVRYATTGADVWENAQPTRTSQGGTAVGRRRGARRRAAQARPRGGVGELENRCGRVRGQCPGVRGRRYRAITRCAPSTSHPGARGRRAYALMGPIGARGGREFYT